MGGVLASVWRPLAGFAAVVLLLAATANVVLAPVNVIGALSVVAAVRRPRRVDFDVVLRVDLALMATSVLLAFALASGELAFVVLTALPGLLLATAAVGARVQQTQLRGRWLLARQHREWKASQLARDVERVRSRTVHQRDGSDPACRGGD